jgi:hypothetical protein
MQSSFERPQYSLSTIYRRKSDVELVCDADPVERRPPHQVNVVQHDRPVHARQEHHRCGPRHDDAQPAGPPFPQVPDARPARCRCRPARDRPAREAGLPLRWARDPSRRPGQHADAEALLQAADRVPQGRGRDSEPKALARPERSGGHEMQRPQRRLTDAR